MHDSARIVLYGLLHVSARVCPAGLAKYATAQEIARDHSSEAVEPHDFGVPHTHHVETTCVCGVDFKTGERRVTHLASVFHPVACPEREGHSAQRLGKNEVSVGAAGIYFNRLGSVFLCAVVERRTLIDV